LDIKQIILENLDNRNRTLIHIETPFDHSKLLELHMNAAKRGIRIPDKPLMHGKIVAKEIYDSAPDIHYHQGFFEKVDPEDLSDYNKSSMRREGGSSPYNKFGNTYITYDQNSGLSHIVFNTTIVSGKVYADSADHEGSYFEKS